MIGAVLARKAIAEAFQALNRHELSKFMAAWHEESVFVYPGEIPQSGTFRGKTAVQDWFRNFLEQFPKIQFEMLDICVKDISALTGTNVLAAHWNIHLTNRGGRVGHNSGVTVITLKNARVILARDYIFDLGENFRLNWSPVA